MYNPTMRLLAVLEFLQSRGEVSGHELSRLLEIEERSVRRYIMMLRDMGIPIEGERGRHGGYSLRPGFRLPPLMFTPDEITAVMMGLMLMREVGTATTLAVESATAKIERVLPEHIAVDADALRNALYFEHVDLRTYTVSLAQIITFSRAVYERKSINMTYQSASGEMTTRMIAPYGVVLHARGWYVPAYCYLREDMRLFRLDRVRAADFAAQTFTPPANFEPQAFVFESLARMPNTYTFEVIFHAPIETVREVIPAHMGGLEAVEKSGQYETFLRCYSDDPHWFARYLTTLEIPFTILNPPELKSAIRGLAEALLATL